MRNLGFVRHTVLLVPQLKFLKPSQSNARLYEKRGEDFCQDRGVISMTYEVCPESV